MIQISILDVVAIGVICFAAGNLFATTMWCKIIPRIITYFVKETGNIRGNRSKIIIDLFNEDKEESELE